MRNMASPFVYLADRAVLSLSGPDTITLLERLVTHDTTDWAPGDTRYGALLTPQGKVLSDYLALRTPEGVLLDVAEAHAADLAKRLKMFRLRAKVEIEILDAVFVVAGIEPAPHGVRPISGAQQVYLDPRYPGGRFRGFATKESWAAWYGYHPAEWSRPIDAYHQDRIAHGIPEQGPDFGPAEVFPADINMDILGGVALKKGCFVGQEVASRMHRKGGVRKRTIALAFHDATPASGTPVVAGEVDVGILTSVAEGLALALVRVDRLAKALDGGGLVSADTKTVDILTDLNTL